MVQEGKGRAAPQKEVGCYTGLFLVGIQGFPESTVVEALPGLSALKLDYCRNKIFLIPALYQQFYINHDGKG